MCRYAVRMHPVWVSGCIRNTHYPNDYILMVADNAAWHKSKGLVIPDNIEIFPLLPYTPELNPIEMI